MQRRNNDRSSCVLVLAQTHEQYRNWRCTTKNSLHAEWELSSTTALNPNEAINFINEREDLEIIHIAGAIFTARSEQFVEEVLAITSAIKEHPYKPWLSLGPKLYYLKPVFEAANIHIDQRKFEDVLFDRWKSQLIQEKDELDAGWDKVLQMFEV